MYIEQAEVSQIQTIRHKLDEEIVKIFKIDASQHIVVAPQNVTESTFDIVQMWRLFLVLHYPKELGTTDREKRIR